MMSSLFKQGRLTMRETKQHLKSRITSHKLLSIVYLRSSSVNKKTSTQYLHFALKPTEYYVTIDSSI